MKLTMAHMQYSKHRTKWLVAFVWGKNETRQLQHTFMILSHDCDNNESLLEDIPSRGESLLVVKKRYYHYKCEWKISCFNPERRVVRVQRQDTMHSFMIGYTVYSMETIARNRIWFVWYKANKFSCLHVWFICQMQWARDFNEKV